MKHPRVSPKPRTPRTAYGRPISIWEQFFHASEHGEAFTAGFHSGPHLTSPPTSFRDRSINSNGEAVGGSADSRLSGLRRSQTFSSLNYQRWVNISWCGQAHRTLLPRRRSCSKFSAQLLPILSIATRSFPRMATLCYVKQFITPLAHIEMNRLVCL